LFSHTRVGRERRGLIWHYSWAERGEKLKIAQYRPDGTKNFENIVVMTATGIAGPGEVPSPGSRVLYMDRLNMRRPNDRWSVDPSGRQYVHFATVSDGTEHESLYTAIDPPAFARAVASPATTHGGSNQQPRPERVRSSQAEYQARGRGVTADAQVAPSTEPAWPTLDQRKCVAKAVPAATANILTLMLLDKNWRPPPEEAGAIQKYISIVKACGEGLSNRGLHRLSWSSAYRAVSEYLESDNYSGPYASQNRRQAIQSTRRWYEALPEDKKPNPLLVFYNVLPRGISPGDLLQMATKT
jgi:hypothetical protein